MSNGRTLISLLILQVILLGAGLGCDNTIAPEPGAAFVFSPRPGTVDAIVNQALRFDVSRHAEPVAGAVWNLNGREVGVGSRYDFVAAVPGSDTLTAVVSWGDGSTTQQWIIRSLVDPTAAVTFRPAQDRVDVTVAESFVFHMTPLWPDSTEFRWERNHQFVSAAASYEFVAATPGRDTLRALGTAHGRTVSKTWAVQSYPPGQLRPLAPQNLQITHDGGAISLAVSWQAPQSGGSTIVAYEVAVSYEGPLDENNWSRGEALAEVTAEPGVGVYSASLTNADRGLQPGREGWVAVASRSAYGDLCAAPPNLAVAARDYWWIRGTVTDLTGLPIANAVVQDASLYRAARTDSSGRFLVGPFEATDAVTLRTRTTETVPVDSAAVVWYDEASATLKMNGPRRWDFRLMRNTPLTTDCAAYDGDFLTLLRALTYTDNVTTHRPTRQLYKWESYPVSVFVPDFVSDDGLDYGALCRQAVGWWNQAMGEEYLTLVTDPSAAGMYFRFGRDLIGFQGKLIIMVPGAGFYTVGDQIPELAEVYVQDNIPSAQLVQEVALHELGHGLGMGVHADCREYLMNPLPSGSLANGPEHAITDDEKRVVQAIRRLPQGVDMSLILGNVK